jgi:outer membrane lipoprotein carrier protein
MRSLFLVIAVLLTSARIPASNVEAVVHGLEARYKSAKTLKAVFLESYSDGHGGKSAESGTVYFSRPGRMRWEYESPEKKLFLVDGTNVWLYVPADRTASRARMKESSDWRTPLALLVGKADLTKLCRELQIVRTSSENGDSGQLSDSAGTALRCIPRDAPTGDTNQRVLIEVNAQDYLTRVVIRDAGEITTEFRFGNWQENVPLPESMFHFQPPPGVSIVDEESLFGETRQKQ